MRTNSTNPAIFQGGKNVYGAAVGILMLETSFPRVLGDIGNAATWPFPVMYRVVPDASPDHVVRRRGEGLLEAFISAGRDMVRHGADGITTNCGFLALFQDELATALGVPVATSSLMQVPFVERNAACRQAGGRPHDFRRFSDRRSPQGHRRCSEYSHRRH